jgi:hypothetical protein
MRPRYCSTVELSSVTADDILGAEQRAYEAFWACECARESLPAYFYEATRSKPERLSGIFERWKKQIIELKIAARGFRKELLRLVELGGRIDPFRTLEETWVTAFEASSELARELLCYFDIVQSPEDFFDPTIKKLLAERLDILQRFSFTAERCRVPLSQGSTGAIELLRRQHEGDSADRLSRRRKKQSREPQIENDCETKFIGGLTAHHEYSNGICDNYDPVVLRKFHEDAKISSGSASKYFKKHFGGHKQYASACRRREPLCSKLQELNNDAPTRMRKLIHDYSSDPLAKPK